MSAPFAFLENVADDLASLSSREEHLITIKDYGLRLSPCLEDFKQECNLVQGCASATHIICNLNPDGTLHFEGDSQSFISKGYLYILFTAFNNAPPEKLLKEADTHIQHFVQKAQIRQGLTPSRANVFENIYQFMKFKAIEALTTVYSESENI